MSIPITPITQTLQAPQARTSNLPLKMKITIIPTPLFYGVFRNILLLLYLVPTLIFLVSCEDPKSSTPFRNTPFNKQELQQLIQSKLKNKQPLSEIDTSYITDMSGLFAGMQDFNGDISGWNTSHVSDMSNMFAGAKAFNQDLGNWDTSAVTNMAGMFKGATSFGKDQNWGAMLDNGLAANVGDGITRSSHESRKYIGSWDTSSVQDMSGMFEGAASFNAPLTKWDFTEVLSTQAMFRGAEAFSSVIVLVAPELLDSSSMFEGAAAFDQPVVKWRTPRVRTTKNMFKGAAKFNQPPVLDKNDDSKNWTLPPTVEDTSYMFEGATSFNQNLSAWNLAEEAKRKDMFNGSPILKEKAKLPRVGNQEIDPLEKPSTLEAGKVQTTAMELTWSSVKGAADYRLYYSTKKGFGLMDTGVTARHFSTAGPFQLALEGLASGTLYYFKLVATGEKYWSSPVSELAQRTKLAVPQGFRASVPAQNAHEQIQLTWTAVAGAASYTVYYSKDAGDLNDLSAFDAGSDPKTKGKKAGITATTANIAGLEGWAHYSFRIVAVAKEGAHLNSLLGSPIAYKVAKIRPATKAKLVEAIKVLYKGYGTLATDTTVKDDDTKEGATASLATIDTGLIPDMSYLFKGKEHFNGDISGWDTRKVTTMKQMFGGSTTSGDGADQKVNFHGAKAFNQDIGGWDVREVTDMSGMFMDAVKFNNGGSPAINNWKTLKVTDMSGMFLQASGFDQPIGGWDVGKVTTMGAMFFQAAAFNRPIGSWTVAQVTNMSTMFYAAKVFNQPIGTWDVSGITVADNMSGMFYSAAAFSKSLSAWEEHLQQALKTLPARIFDSSGLACSGSDDEKNKIKAKWPSSWQSSCS